MKIETKYDVGDEVWIMIDNRAKRVRITSISVVKSIHYFYIMYGYGDEFTQVYESNLFPTKEELLKSL